MIQTNALQATGTIEFTLPVGVTDMVFLNTMKNTQM